MRAKLLGFLIAMIAAAVMIVACAGDPEEITEAPGVVSATARIQVDLRASEQQCAEQLLEYMGVTDDYGYCSCVASGGAELVRNGDLSVVGVVAYMGEGGYPPELVALWQDCFTDDLLRAVLRWSCLDLGSVKAATCSDWAYCVARQPHRDELVRWFLSGQSDDSPTSGIWVDAKDCAHYLRPEP